MLSGLRYFEHALKDNGRGQPKAAFSWGAVDMVSVARCFMQLCAKAIDVFSSEPRLLDFSSPCYVLGMRQWFCFQLSFDPRWLVCMSVNPSLMNEAGTI